MRILRLPVQKVSPGGEPISEPEITQPVDLCLPNGRLNPQAVGWTRTALHRSNLRGWGRNKRFEYWSISVPEGIFSVNISHHDYRANVSVTFWNRTTNMEIRQGGNTWLPRHRRISDPQDRIPMQASRREVEVSLTPVGLGTVVEASSSRIRLSLRIEAEPGHESMGVVVPWTDKLFQYTKKDNCLRASGVATVDGAEYRIAPQTSSAVHDRGRGRWPYFTFWNWGAGSGRTEDGRDIGLQVGGKWTDGTPSTENWIRVNGRLHKISEHLDWQYHPADWLRPWTLTGPTTKIEFVPDTHLYHRFNRWIVLSRTDTCLGRYSGEVRLADGEVVNFSDIPGHVEEVERRW